MRKHSPGKNPTLLGLSDGRKRGKAIFEIWEIFFFHGGDTGARVRGLTSLSAFRSPPVILTIKLATTVPEEPPRKTSTKTLHPSFCRNVLISRSEFSPEGCKHRENLECWALSNADGWISFWPYRLLLISSEYSLAHLHVLQLCTCVSWRHDLRKRKKKCLCVQNTGEKSANAQPVNFTSLHFSCGSFTPLHTNRGTIREIFSHLFSFLPSRLLLVVERFSFFN